MCGIFPLKILKLLSDRVGLLYPVQENFDGAFGISSGKRFRRISATYLTETHWYPEHLDAVCQWMVSLCVHRYVLVSGGRGVQTQESLAHPNPLLHSVAGGVVLGQLPIYR